MSRLGATRTMAGNNELRRWRGLRGARHHRIGRSPLIVRDGVVMDSRLAMQVTVGDYFAQHRAGHEGECVLQVVDAATETVRRHNLILAMMEADGVLLVRHPKTQTMYSSGWRPASVNACTAGAAVKSTHITGEGGDLYDPEGKLDAWCLMHQDKLQEVGLWLEDPQSTVRWCHLDRKQRANRIFKIK